MPYGYPQTTTINRDQSIFNNFYMMLIFLLVVSVVGILAGVVYYDMQILEDSLKTVDFAIPIEVNSTVTGAYNMSHFQDILGVTIYPILGIRSALPYLSYFAIFGLVIALAITAYISTKNPVFFVLHLLFTIVIVYFSFIISNEYITLLTNPFINSLMTDFVIYNKLMIWLPQILFFTSLIFGVIAFSNIMKPQTNYNVTGLNYGGDY